MSFETSWGVNSAREVSESYDNAIIFAVFGGRLTGSKKLLIPDSDSSRSTTVRCGIRGLMDRRESFSSSNYAEQEHREQQELSTFTSEVREASFPAPHKHLKPEIAIQVSVFQSP